MEANSDFLKHLPQKMIEGIKSKIALLEFCRKSSWLLSRDIYKTVIKCEGFYKKIHQLHEKCHIPLVPKITNLPGKYQHMAHLQDRLQEDIKYIIKVKSFNEEDINQWVGKDSSNTYLLEDMCNATTEVVTHIETQ